MWQLRTGKGGYCIRRSHRDPEVDSYLRKAERDLATASRMSAEGAEFADVVCFHAEQCAEKALKGLILGLGDVPPRTHDLMVLLRTISRIERKTHDLERFCLVLTDYAVAPRYPGWEDVVGEVNLDDVLEAAMGVLDRVLARLGLTETDRSG